MNSMTCAHRLLLAFATLICGLLMPAGAARAEWRDTGPLPTGLSFYGLADGGEKLVAGGWSCEDPNCSISASDNAGAGWSMPQSMLSARQLSSGRLAGRPDGTVGAIASSAGSVTIPEGEQPTTTIRYVERGASGQTQATALATFHDDPNSAGMSDIAANGQGDITAVYAVKHKYVLSETWFFWADELRAATNPLTGASQQIWHADEGQVIDLALASNSAGDMALVFVALEGGNVVAKVAVKAPDGAWTVHQVDSLVANGDRWFSAPAVAVSEAGDVAVSWAHNDRLADPDISRRKVAIRRAEQNSFSAPVTLAQLTGSLMETKAPVAFVGRTPLLASGDGNMRIFAGSDAGVWTTEHDGGVSQNQYSPPLLKAGRAGDVVASWVGPQAYEQQAATRSADGTWTVETAPWAGSPPMEMIVDARGRASVLASKCSDPALYLCEEALHVFQLDPLPSALITSPMPDLVAERDQQFTFDSDSDGATFQCRLLGPNAFAWTACESPKTLTGLRDGKHTFGVRPVIDDDPDSDTNELTYGHESTQEFTVDGTAPTSSIGFGPTGTTEQTAASFAFSASEADTTFECSMDGDSFAACDSPASYYNLPVAEHTFSVRATDAAGNTGPPASRTFTVVAPAPNNGGGGGGEACTIAAASLRAAAAGTTARAAASAKVRAAASCGRPEPVESCAGGGEERVVAGEAVALALDQSGCFNKAKGGWVSSGGRVRLNGLDLSFPQGAKLSIENAEYHVYITGRAYWNLGPSFQLPIAKLDWRTQGTGPTVALDVGKKVGPLMLSRALELKLSDDSDGTSKIEFENVKLPGKLAPQRGRVATGDGVSANLNLSATGEKGIQGAGSITVAHSYLLGQVPVRALTLGFDTATGTLSGSGTIDMPAKGVASPEVVVAMTVKPALSRKVLADWKLGAAITVQRINKPLAYGFFLQKLGGGVDGGTAGDPFMTGSLAVSFGPEFTLGGKDIPGLFSVDGTGKMLFQPGGLKVELEGSGTLVNQQISKGKVAWDMWAGETTFSGTTMLKQGNIELAATIPPSRIGAEAFELNGHGQLKMKTFFGDWQSDAQFLMTQVGTVGCVGKPGTRFGMGYRWGQSFQTFAGNCDIGKWKQLNKSAVHAAQAGAPTSFELPSNLPVAAVALRGASSAPKVALTGPDGAKIDAPASGAPLQSTNATIIPSADEPVTYVVLVRPKGGRWTASTSDGAPIASVLTADGLPQPKVRVKLAKAGAKRVLRYTVKPLPGQQVRFVETGRGASQDLGVAKGASGALRFRPAAGPGGKRTIVAQVIQDGLPRAALTVARFTVPAPPKVAAPRRVKLRRSGAKLLATWKPARGAARYSVTVKLSDGRNLPLETRRTKLTVKSVAAATKGTVQVVAIGADGRVSKASKAKLAAVKAKRKRR
jgi:hypothetical protein